MEFAIDCMTIVLPAFGGDTMSLRWPLPIGAAMSMTRPIRLPASVSSRSRSEAYSGVSLLKSTRSLAASMLPPLTDSRRTRGLNFSRRCSPSRICLTVPVTASPLRRPYLRTMDRET